MSENRYNLIDEVWIPVAGKGKVSLKEIFSDPSITALGGNPVEKIAIFKLLLAVGQAAFTPKNEAEWQSTTVNSFRANVLAYLDSQYNHFYLYGENPFLQMKQMKEIARAKKKNYGDVNYGDVQMEVATRNTTVVTEIQQERPLSDSEKALLLVVLMGFALGGKKTDNSVVLTRGYTQKSKSSKPGASLLTAGVLHSFVFSKSVAESVFLNLFSTEKINGLKFFPAGVGYPPWERMPTGEDDETAQKLKESYIGRLVPLCRFVLLADDRLHYSEGLAHKTYADGVVDLSVTVDFSAKPKPKVLWADPEKRPWRQLPVLLSFLNAGSQKFKCHQIENCWERFSDFSLWSGGVKVSSNAGEQYVSGSDDFVESEIQFSSRCFGTIFFETLQTEMQKMEEYSKVLYGCVSKYCRKMKRNEKSISAHSLSLYWQLCERLFQKLVEGCEREDGGVTARALRKKFWAFVLQVFDRSCPAQTARQLEAWAEYRPRNNREEEK